MLACLSAGKYLLDVIEINKVTGNRITSSTVNFILYCTVLVSTYVLT